MYLFDFLVPPLLVGVGFLMLPGWCAVGLVSERLGLMVFSLVPRWIKDRGWGFFFTIASAARSLCSQSLINTKHMI